MSRAMVRVIFAFFVVTSGLVVVESFFLSEALPNMHRCSRNIFNLSGCVAKSIESMKPLLASGITLLDIQPFEPYYYEQIKLRWNDVYSSTATFKDILIKGITNYAVIKSQVNWDVTDIVFHVRFPLVQLFSTYDIKYLLQFGFDDQYYLPLVGYRIQVTFADIIAEITIRSFSYLDHKETQFRVDSVDTNLDVKSASIIMVNKDYTQISDYETKMHFIKELQILAAKSKTEIESIISNVIENVTKSICLAFPWDMLYIK